MFLQLGRKGDEAYSNDPSGTFPLCIPEIQMLQMPAFHDGEIFSLVDVVISIGIINSNENMTSFVEATVSVCHGTTLNLVLTVSVALY